MDESKRTLAPSKCTVYVSNLPFSLTNCDLHKIFEKFGKLVKVTILRHKLTRKSKGVAFLLFLEEEGACECARKTNGCVMFGRTLSANIAKDNGRAAEFIKRREYPNKSKCYECGGEGHLSYVCPKNVLGERVVEGKKRKRKKRTRDLPTHHAATDTEEDLQDESLSAAISYQQELREQGSEGEVAAVRGKRKRLKRSSYFSDEEEEEEIE